MTESNRPLWRGLLPSSDAIRPLLVLAVAVGVRLPGLRPAAVGDELDARDGRRAEQRDGRGPGGALGAAGELRGVDTARVGGADEVAGVDPRARAARGEARRGAEGDEHVVAAN